MPRTPAKPDAKPGTAIMNWADEMARDAKLGSDAEANSGGSAFFSLRGGTLSLNEVPMPGNRIAAVVVDSIFENVYYEGAYNPDAVSPPKCFAFAREESKLRPHDSVFEHGQEENSVCLGCIRNEWGSAATGRGKACSNRRRVSLLAAGEVGQGNRLELYDDNHFETSPIALLKLPVTSVKGYANYVQQVANVITRPLYGVVSLVQIVPDPRTQFKVAFSLLDRLPDRLIPIIMRRRKETQSMLEQPYQLDFEPPAAPAPPPKGKPGLRVAASRPAKY